MLLKSDSASLRFCRFGFLALIQAGIIIAAEPSSEAVNSIRPQRDYTKPFLYDGVPARLRLPPPDLKTETVIWRTKTVELLVLSNIPTISEFLMLTNESLANKQIELLTKTALETLPLPKPTPRLTLKPLLKTP